MTPQDHEVLALYNAPYPTIVCDSDGRILYANPVAIGISGCKENDLMGRSAAEVFVGESERADFGGIFSGFGDVTNGGQQLVVASFGNTGKAFRVQSRFVDTLAGRRVILYATDLQIEGIENSSLQSALALARRESSAKSEFLAMMSHEIRTPLTGVMGILEMLRISQKDPGLLRLVDTALESAGSLQQILSDVLDLSKMNAAGVSFREGDFDVRSLLGSIMESVEPQARKRKNILSTVVMQDVPQVLHGDSGRLRQIIMNLVTNAIKFTENGKVNVAVRLIKKRQGRLVVRFEVSDTGVGIPNERQDELFKDFSTLHPTLSRQFGGVGLGLSICKRIVSAAGGVIGAASNPGEGSFFWFTMPFGEEVPGFAHDTAAPGQPALLVQPVKGGRVLLVDDNETNRMVMRAYLEHAGYAVEDVEGAVDAIDCLRRGEDEYGCVLMDLAMPGMDGLEAIRLIRSSNSAFARIPVIGITAFGQREQHQDMLRNGMNAVLTKPINRLHLVSTVNRYAGGTETMSGFVPEDTKASVPQQSKTSVVLDEKVLRELSAITGIKGARAIIDSWLSLLSAVVSRIPDFSGASADLVALARQGHKLAGSSGQVGALRIQGRALALEAACKRGDHDAARRHASSLVEEAAEVKSKLQLLLAELD